MDHPEGRGATRTSSCANEIAIGILLSRESIDCAVFVNDI